MKKVLFLIILLILYMQQFYYIDLSEYQSETIQVEIKGAVNKEGVYTLPYGSSLDLLLKKAKGVKEDGDLSLLNKNKKLMDQDVIVIPKKSEKQKISINSANLEQLSSLKGIGPAIAQKIIDYRTQIGSFQKIEDIMKIKGIKEKMFSKIKDDICL